MGFFFNRFWEITLVYYLQLSRAGQETPNVLLTFALFDVYPLEFVGVAEITRRVQNELLIAKSMNFPRDQIPV